MSLPPRHLSVALVTAAIVVLTKLGTAATPPDEATKKAARQLAVEGIELMQKEQWSEALARLSKAYALFPAPTVAVLEARTLERMGDLVKAAGRYDAARRAELSPDSPDAFRRATREAADELQRLEAKIPKLSISVEGAPQGSVVVTVDGRRMNGASLSAPVALNPGEHVVRARRGGGVLAEASVVLVEGAQERVVLRLTPEQPRVATEAPDDAKAEDDAAGTGQRTLGFVALGLGAAGLAVGATAGVIMLDAKSSLDARCSPLCAPDDEDELSRFRTARTVSTVGYSAGIAGAVLGVVLLVSDSGPRKSPSAVYVDGRTAGVRGTF